jgi:hypothetical protein
MAVDNFQQGIAHTHHSENLTQHNMNRITTRKLTLDESPQSTGSFPIFSYQSFCYLNLILPAF